MKYTQVTSALLFAAASISTLGVSAVPIATHNTTAPAATSADATVSTAAPASTVDTYGPLETILPVYTSTYHSDNGAVDFSVSRASVSRHTWNNGKDTSALVTFKVPEYHSSRQCQVVFDLTAYSAYASGTQKAQLFTSLAPATASANSWPSGNLRDQHLGTINVIPGGRASWEAGSGVGATAQGYFSCSEVAGKVFGGEVVPVGDNDEISWTANYDGVKIIVW